MNMEENSLCHIHLVKDDLVGYQDWKGNLDLLNIVMIGLAKELPEHSDLYELHRLLGALFSQELTQNERLDLINKEYNIPIDDGIRKDVSVMCNLSQGSMLKIEDMIEDLNNLGEAKLVQLSDKLWELGNLDDIKEKVSTELFNLHIGINMIGIWKSEGWDSIIGEHADFVPYIPVVLQEFELCDVRYAFENVISLFPKETVFKSDNVEYYDIYNFFTSFNHKVQNEKLKAITPEKRREIIKLKRQKIRILDELTVQYWSDDSEKAGWKQVFDYIHQKVLL